MVEGAELLQRQFLPLETWEGVRPFLAGRGGGLISLFSLGREAKDSWFGSHSRRGGRSGSGGGPGVWLWSGWEQMAPDPRVPAAAAAPRERPAGVRRGGWTGGGGRKEHPSSSHSPRPVASLRQRLQPFPTVLLGDVCGEGYGRRRHRKSKHHALGCGEESGLQATDLEKGKACPSPQFLSCDISIEELTPFYVPAPPPRVSPGDQTGLWVGDPLIFSFQKEEPTTVRALVPRSGAGIYVWGRVLREMPTEVFSSADSVAKQPLSGGNSCGESWLGWEDWGPLSNLVFPHNSPAQAGS